MSLVTVLKIIQLLRKFISPFIELFIPFSRKLRERREFEKLNLTDERSRPFQREKASFCFEVSSDGEFEQIRPLLDQLLNRRIRVELIYSSPSLESRINTLKDNENLRVLRLPLLTAEMGNYCIEQWVSASHLYLCRYDFFPELLLKGLEIKSRGGVFGLIWASLKNKDFLFHAGFGKKKWFFTQVYKSFNRFITPLQSDRAKFEKLGIERDKIQVGEFRLLQILQRVSQSVSTLQRRFAILNIFNNFLSSFSMNKRYILGSVWAADLGVFKDMSFNEEIRQGKSCCIVVPHDLSLTNINSIKKIIEQESSLPVFEIKNDLDIDKIPGGHVVLLNLKGILCELYGLFGHAYVGGGFGRSVHSLLEPFVAGSHVYCGPKVHRSTEYDLIMDINDSRIRIINRPEEFYSSLFGHEALDTGHLDELSLKGKKAIESIVNLENFNGY